MKILLTGASGFVGLNIAEAFLKNGHHVSLADIHSPSKFALQSFDNLSGVYDFAKLDVTDFDAVSASLESSAPDIILHCAAICPSASTEFSDVRRVTNVNIGGLINVLEAARKSPVKRIIYTSSGAVYGSAAAGAGLLSEKLIPQPNHIYGITKFSAESFGRHYRESLGIEFVRLRVGSVFGPWEWDTGLRQTLAPMLQIMELFLKGRPVILPREGRRDWIYSRDLADAVVKVAQAKTLRYDLYNVACGEEWTIAEWCGILQESLSGFEFRMAEYEGEENVDFHGALDRPPLCIDRIARDAEFHARSLPMIVDDYLSWFERSKVFFKSFSQ